MIESIRIRVSIISSYVIIGILTLCIGASALLTYSDIRATSERTGSVYVQSFTETLTVLYHLEDIGVYLLSEGSPNAINIMPGPSPAELIELVNHHLSLCEEHLKLIEPDSEGVPDSDPTSMFREAQKEWIKLSILYKNYLDSYDTLEPELQIESINTKLLPGLKTTIVRLHDFQLATIQAMAEDQIQIHDAISKSQSWIKPLLFTGIIILTLLCWLAIRLVIKPINMLVETMVRIQKGLTTARFTYTGKDEMGYLALTFNDMVTKLHNSVTQANTAKAALEKNQRLFEDLYEFAPDSIIMIDSNGIIQRANQHTEILFGCNREWIVGKKFEALLTEENKTESGPDFAHIFLDYLNSSRNQIRLKRKDGVEFNAEINFKAMETDSGPYIAASIREFDLRS